MRPRWVQDQEMNTGNTKTLRPKTKTKTLKLSLQTSREYNHWF